MNDGCCLSLLSVALSNTLTKSSVGSLFQYISMSHFITDRTCGKNSSITWGNGQGKLFFWLTLGSVASWCSNLAFLHFPGKPVYACAHIKNQSIYREIIEVERLDRDKMNRHQLRVTLNIQSLNIQSSPETMLYSWKTSYLKQSSLRCLVIL